MTKKYSSHPDARLLPHGRRLARAALVSSVLCALALQAPFASAANSDDTNIPSDATAYPQGVKKAPAVVAQCMACHGPTGISQIPEWPNLAGQSKAYLTAQLKDIKSGKRSHPMMAPAIAVITQAQIPVLAEWFSAQAPSVPPKRTLEAKAAPAAAATCVACHDVPSMPANPYLHGQKAPYLIEQLQAFKKGTRKNATMTPMASGLSDQDIVQLAEHFSSLAPVTNSSGK